MAKRSRTTRKAVVPAELPATQGTKLVISPDLLLPPKKEFPDKLTPAQYADKYNTAFLQGLVDARFIVLEKRSNHGDGNCWAVHFVFNTTPLADNSSGEFIANRMLGSNLSFETAELLLRLLFDGMPQHAWVNLDGQVKDYIINNLAPLEWQVLLTEGNPTMVAKYTVYGYDTPSLPEVTEEMEDEYFAAFGASKETKGDFALAAPSYNPGSVNK
jgi:hypothetical protein